MYTTIDADVDSEFIIPNDPDPVINDYKCTN